MAVEERKVSLALDSTERMFGDVSLLKVDEGTRCKSGLAPTDATLKSPTALLVVQQLQKFTVMDCITMKMDPARNGGFACVVGNVFLTSL